MLLKEKEIIFVDQSLQHALAILYGKGLVSHETYLFYSRMLCTVSEGYLACLDYMKEL